MEYGNASKPQQNWSNVRQDFFHDFFFVSGMLQVAKTCYVSLLLLTAGSASRSADSEETAFSGADSGRRCSFFK